MNRFYYTRLIRLSRSETIQLSKASSSRILSRYQTVKHQDDISQ